MKAILINTVQTKRNVDRLERKNQFIDEILKVSTGSYSSVI